MSRMGYQGMFAPKCKPGQPEGLAMFYKRDKFVLEETKTVHLNEQVPPSLKQSDAEIGLLAALKHTISDNLLVIGENTYSWVALRFITFTLENWNASPNTSLRFAFVKLSGITERK